MIEPMKLLLTPNHRRGWHLLLLMLAAAGVPPLHAQRAPESVMVLVTTADAMILAQEALDNAPLAFAVTLKRITLFPPQARVQASVAGTCDITLDGTPVLSGGRITISQPKEYRDGWSCAAVPELRPQAWDLAQRLQRASCDPALTGPRLPTRKCLVAGAVQLKSISVQGDGMHAVVLVSSP
jgi:transcriptional regulator of acetoin/glycerol metabolism